VITLRIGALVFGLSGIIQSVNDWFAHFHLRPPLGPTVTEQCRLFSRLSPTVDQAFPRRRRATRQLTFRQSLFNPLRRTEQVPYHTTGSHPMVPPRYLSLLPALFRTAAFVQVNSGARHFSRDAQMAFRILTGTLPNFRRMHILLSNRPNSLRSPIHRTLERLLVAQIRTPYATPAYLRKQRSFRTSSARPICHQPCPD